MTPLESAAIGQRDVDLLEPLWIADHVAVGQDVPIGADDQTGAGGDAVPLAGHQTVVERVEELHERVAHPVAHPLAIGDVDAHHGRLHPLDGAHHGRGARGRDVIELGVSAGQREKCQRKCAENA